MCGQRNARRKNTETKKCADEEMSGRSFADEELRDEEMPCKDLSEYAAVSIDFR